MNFLENYEQFTKSTKDNFPLSRCIKEYQREPHVFDSDTPYICLLIDERFDDYWKLIILYPYICKESKTLITFGWVDKSGNIYSNIENSTQLLDEFVVGFREYDDTDTGYKKLRNEFVEKINSQYDD